MSHLGLGAGETDLKAFGLAEPDLALSFGDPIDPLVADLDQPVSLGRLGSQERASDASVLVDARGSERPSAGSEEELAFLEVGVRAGRAPVRRFTGRGEACRISGPRRGSAAMRVPPTVAVVQSVWCGGCWWVAARSSACRSRSLALCDSLSMLSSRASASPNLVASGSFSRPRAQCRGAEFGVPVAAVP